MRYEWDEAKRQANLEKHGLRIFQGGRIRATMLRIGHQPKKPKHVQKHEPDPIELEEKFPWYIRYMRPTSGRRI